MIWAFGCALWTLSACTTSSYQEVPVPGAGSPAGPEEREAYRIRPGDSVSFTFVRNHDLDGDLLVRPDGRISLPLIGEVAAAGLTPQELRSEVSRRYEAFIARTRYGEVLKEGDQLRLRFADNPELNLDPRVRPDGTVSLPLAGDVPAAGRSAEEFRQDLVARYAAWYRNPDITIEAKGDALRKVYPGEAYLSVVVSKVAKELVFVGGEVSRPGAVPFQVQLSAMQAIQAAGGSTDRADLAKIVILRRGQFEPGEWIQADLGRSLSGPGVGADPTLRPGDVLIVPRNGIAKVGLWVQQYVREALPVLTAAYVVIVPARQSSETTVVPQSQVRTPATQPSSAPSSAPSSVVP